MRTCCSCRAPQTLSGCGEFATNWRAPNTSLHDSSHFSVAWLRPHLKEQWATPFTARRLPPLRAPAAVSRARATSPFIGASLTAAHGSLASGDNKDPDRPSSVRSAPLAVHLGYLRREGDPATGTRRGVFGPVPTMPISCCSVSAAKFQGRTSWSATWGAVNANQ